MKRSMLSLTVVLLACAVTPARAEIYFGGSLGQATLEVDRVDADDTGYKVFGGFRFFKFFGIEGDFVDYGNLDGSSSGVNLDSTVKSLDAFAVGVIPIKRFEIFGKAGVSAWDSDSKRTGSITETDNASGFDFSYGVGGAFLVTEHFAIRAEWEAFQLDHDDLSMTSVGLELRF